MTGDLKALRATRRRAMMQAAMRICVMALSFYVVFGIILYTCQRFFLYPGQYVSDMGTPLQEGFGNFTDLHFPTADGLQGRAWYAPARDAGKPVIVFFHGNGVNIKGFAPKAQFYTDKGYGGFICEYRGFGGRSGKPTEQGLFNDAEACVSALKEKGYNSRDLVYHGESLGTGVVVHLSLGHPPRGIVLETPYSSVLDLAKTNYGWYPVDWMLEDKFDSISKIGKIKVPLLVVHGKSDAVIPYSEGQRLFDKANRPKELHAITGGGHNDLYEFGAGDIISGWLDKQIKEDKAQ